MEHKVDMEKLALIAERLERAVSRYEVEQKKIGEHCERCKNCECDLTCWKVVVIYRFDAFHEQPMNSKRFSGGAYSWNLETEIMDALESRHQYGWAGTFTASDEARDIDAFFRGRGHANKACSAVQAIDNRLEVFMFEVLECCGISIDDECICDE